jgi:hypothetical protein
MLKWFRRFVSKNNELSHPYYYVFVRQNLSIAQQLVQSNHASFALSQQFWNFSCIPSVILIGVKDKNELESTISLLMNNQIGYVTFFELDNDEGLTAVATAPIWHKDKKKVLSSYNLWKAVETNRNNHD